MNQRTFKAQQDFAAAHPELAEKAMAVINAWGAQKMTLLHAIGEALKAERDGTEAPRAEIKYARTVRRRSHG